MCIDGFLLLCGNSSSAASSLCDLFQLELASAVCNCQSEQFALPPDFDNLRFNCLLTPTLLQCFPVPCLQTAAHRMRAVVAEYSPAAAAGGFHAQASAFLLNSYCCGYWCCSAQHKAQGVRKRATDNTTCSRCLAARALLDGTPLQAAQQQHWTSTEALQQFRNNLNPWLRLGPHSVPGRIAGAPLLRGPNPAPKLQLRFKATRSA